MPITSACFRAAPPAIAHTLPDDRRRLADSRLAERSLAASSLADNRSHPWRGGARCESPAGNARTAVRNRPRVLARSATKVSATTVAAMLRLAFVGVLSARR